MKRVTLEIPYYSCALEELSPEDRRLVDAARAATVSSYSPYSHFSVGAAVLLADGNIVAGSNQENVAFPSGTCAERCAMFYANSRYPDVAPVALAVAARGADGTFTPKPVTPCGACRQVLLQVQIRYGRALRILLYGSEQVYVMDNVECILPFQFDSLE